MSVRTELRLPAVDGAGIVGFHRLGFLELPSRRSRGSLVNPSTSSVVSLRLLGGASVDGSDGPIAARGARGRRLALLAVLAAARGRAVSRDKLVALFWPETDAERVRPLLSDSLYMVRSALGDDALVTSGDDIRLNADRISSDLESFQRLLDEGALAEAVAVYAGPFLDGFHVSDAPDFERWVDGERERLAARYGDALDALAQAGERSGNSTDAVAWLRRLAAHDPYAGRTAARLMHALDRSGNRAAALQHARVHAALLRDEFGADPDPEVATLADRLKADPAAAPVSTAPAVSERSSAAAQLAFEPANQPTLPSRRLPNAGRPVRLVASLALIAAAVAGIALWRAAGNRLTGDASDSSAARSASRVPRRSVAVLPFDDVGAGGDNAYFTDGLTEEVIGALSRVDGLRVAARSSSFALRDAKLDARVIGDTLRVATLLEGSVRREGDRVRVSAQLVDASNGYQLWSRSYDRKVRDVIALQNEIAGEIVSALALQLVPPAGPRDTTAPPNEEAYDLYLRGIFARNKLTGEELRKAMDYFDRAIRLDSAFAPAYAGKATTITPLVWFGHLPREQGFAACRAAALRAVALDESLSEGHVALGMLHFFFEWDWPAAEREFRRAVEVNPNDAHANHFLANFLRATGRLDEAIAARTRALALDPLSVRTGMLLGADYFAQGQYELAEKNYRRAAEMDPRSPTVLGEGPGIDMGLGHVYEKEGRYDAAMQEYLRTDSLTGVPSEQLADLRHAYADGGIRAYWRRRIEQLERDPNGNHDPVHRAWMWARVGDTARTVEWIQRAYRERSLGLVFLGVLPDFEVARRDPRVISIMAAMRLPSLPRRQNNGTT